MAGPPNWGRRSAIQQEDTMGSKAAPKAALVRREGRAGSAGAAARGSVLLAVIGCMVVCSAAARAQRMEREQPVIVQPGAPGSPSRTLPPSTRAVLPPQSAADVRSE